MAEVSGRHIVAALKKASTWDTEVAPGANDGFLFKSENLGVIARESVPNESIGARDDQILCTDKLNFDIGDKSIVNELIFEMFELPLALACGSAGVPTLQTDGYLHTFRPATDIDGIFATFAIEKVDGSIIHVYPTLKFKGFELSGNAGGILECNNTVIPSRFSNNSSTVTSSAMDNVTFRKKCGRINFNQTTFWLNSQSGAALSTSDAINPSSFSFRFMRDMAVDFVSRNESGQNSWSCEEPVETGFPEIMLTLDFPKYSSDTYIDALRDDDHFKMKINYQGALIGTDYYNLAIYFTNLEILNADATVDGAGKIVHPLQFRCKAVDSAPSGMSGTDAFYIEIINTVSSDYLA